MTDPEEKMRLPLELRVGLDQFGEPFVAMALPATVLGFGYTLTPETADAVAETIRAAAADARDRAATYWALLAEGKTSDEAIRHINMGRPHTA